jgi:hypothetical protein
LARPWEIIGIALSGAVAAWILHRNLWRAVLFISPGSLRTDSDSPAGQVQLPPSLIPLSRELIALGFRELGSRYEKPVLRRERLCYDYAHSELKAFATLYLGSFEKPRLFFLTVVQGGFVITANYRRPAREIPNRYLSGGLENVSSDRLLKAHLRRLEPFQPLGEYNAEARLAAERQWFLGHGKSELREENLMGLLWSAAMVALVVAAVIQKL